MLGKLLKHEFIATKRLYLPIYFSTLVLALIVNGFYSIQGKLFDNESLSMISSTFIIFFTVIFFLVLVCCSMSGTIISLYRFYKNVFTDEGYLTNTLPVKPISILLSKMITGLVWSIAGSAVTILAIFLTDFNLLDELIDSINFSVIAEFLGDNVLYITSVILFSLMSLILTLSMAYMAVAIGNLVNTHKAALSIAVYFGSVILFEIVASASLVITDLSYNSDTTIFADHSTFTISYTESAIMFIYAGILLVISALELFFTHFIMKRKLNLT